MNSLPPWIGTGFVYAMVIFGAVSAARWIWGKVPHHKDRSDDVIHRLSELIVAVKEQTAYMKAPAEEKSQEVPPAFLKFMDDWRTSQAQMQAAVDTQVITVEKQNRFVQMFCKTITGNDPAAYEDVTDEEAVIKEEALKLMRRYPNITFAEAAKRARARQTYEPNDRTGFGETA